MRDLSHVRTAYERGEGSLRILADRLAIPYDTVKRRCRLEKWTRPLNDPKTAAGVILQEKVTQKSDPAKSHGVILERQNAPNAVTGVILQEKVTPKSDPAKSHGVILERQNDPNAVTGVILQEKVTPKSVPSMFAAEVTTFPNAMSPDCPAVDTVASVLEAIKTRQKTPSQTQQSSPNRLRRTQRQPCRSAAQGDC